MFIACIRTKPLTPPYAHFTHKTNTVCYCSHTFPND